MSYQLFKRHQELFSHCQFDSYESVNPEVIDSVGADFYTYDDISLLSFVHFTAKENLSNILEKGLIYQRNSKNHLGDGNYCLSYQNNLNNYELINFYKFIQGYLNEDYVLLFGYYEGSIRYCFSGEDNHTGYTVLLEDVPPENITRVLELKDIKINEELTNLIKEQMKADNNKILELIFYK